MRVRSIHELGQLRNGISFFVEEDEKAALHRQVFEDHVHDDGQQRIQLVGLQQRLRDLHQHLKDFFARDFDGLRARLGWNPRHGFLRLCQIQPELGIEIGDAADDGARRVVEHRLVAEIHRRLRLQLQLNGTDRDLVLGFDLGFRGEIAVDLHAVRRLQIDDPPSVVAELEPRMFTGD